MPKPKDEQREAPEAAPRPDAAGTESTAGKTPGREIGGADGPEPTRYGDWERNGRCTDF
jgi:hypothetical protein